MAVTYAERKRTQLYRPAPVVGRSTSLTRANARERPQSQREDRDPGAGNVGGGLGAGLAAAGHDVTYGVRDPDSEKTQQALAATRRGRAASPTEAVQNAEVVVVALRWDAVNDMVEALPSLDGTV